MENTKRVCQDCKLEREEYGIMWCVEHYDEIQDAKNANYKKGFDWKKFWKRFLIRLANRLLELSVLFAIGYALGLQLIRY